MNNSLVNLVNALALERRQDCRKFIDLKFSIYI